MPSPTPFADENLRIELHVADIETDQIMNPSRHGSLCNADTNGLSVVDRSNLLAAAIKRMPNVVYAIESPSFFD